jgi:hypothetical protein
LEPEPFGVIRLDKLRPSYVGALVLAMPASSVVGLTVVGLTGFEPATT